MQDLVKSFLKEKCFAVAGSFKNQSKYAYRVLRVLRGKGYEVYPINPRLKEVEDLKCYASIEEVPVKVDVVDIVTPPEVTEKIVEQCKKVGVTKVWIQPGAESEKAIRFCKDNNIDVVYNLCVMLEAG